MEQLRGPPVADNSVKTPSCPIHTPLSTRLTIPQAAGEAPEPGIRRKGQSLPSLFLSLLQVSVNGGTPPKKTASAFYLCPWAVSKKDLNSGF